MKGALLHKDTCRICRGTKLSKVLSLGPTPLANAFLGEGEKREAEVYFPLDVYLCRECGLVQLLDVVSPEVLFKDYVYVSSTSPVFVRHFKDFAKSAAKRFGLGRRSLVVDIGSNDGILLKPFKEQGVRVLGVEPDKRIAQLARKTGIDTVVTFWSPVAAENIVRHHGRADLVTATNVLAHIDDIHAVVRGVEALLKPDGMFMIEVPYLGDFLRKNLFDTVYHEHLSYFSLSALAAFLKRAGMKLIDVERIPTHGGSLRVFAATARSHHAVHARVGKLLTREKAQRLHRVKTFERYTLRILENREKLLALLSGLRRRGKRIAGYGAPAKGNTLLNFFSVGPELITYIVDDSQRKQGMYTPGKRIPVVSAQQLRTDPPDYLLLIAWNFAESIMQKQQAFKKSGGKFIIPVPTPRIL
jgi:SAM-dependent methyltransferase